MVSSFGNYNDDDEDYDSFPADDGPPAFMLDPDSMAIVRDSGRAGGGEAVVEDEVEVGLVRHDRQQPLSWQRM